MSSFLRRLLDGKVGIAKKFFPGKFITENLFYKKLFLLAFYHGESVLWK